MCATVLTPSSLSYTWISGLHIISIILNRSRFDQDISSHLHVKFQKTSNEIVTDKVYSRFGKIIAEDIQYCPSVFISFGLPTSLLYEQHVYTGLFEMIVGVLTTCHTQYT